MCRSLATRPLPARPGSKAPGARVLVLVEAGRRRELYPALEAGQLSLIAFASRALALIAPRHQSQQSPRAAAPWPAPFTKFQVGRNVRSRAEEAQEHELCSAARATRTSPTASALQLGSANRRRLKHATLRRVQHTLWASGVRAPVLAVEARRRETSTACAMAKSLQTRNVAGSKSPLRPGLAILIRALSLKLDNGALAPILVAAGVRPALSSARRTVPWLQFHNVRASVWYGRSDEIEKASDTLHSHSQAGHATRNPHAHISPSTTQQCNAQKCAHYEGGPWSECSTSCGQGMRFRNATCKREGVVVAPSECINDEAVPILLNETCTGLGPCNSISVVRPHSGESIRRNRVLTVEWQLPQGLQQSDDIYIDLYNSSGFVRRIGDVYPPTNMYSWKINTEIALGADYFVLVYTPNTAIRHEGRSVDFAIMGEAELSISAGCVLGCPEKICLDR